MNEKSTLSQNSQPAGRRFSRRSFVGAGAAGLLFHPALGQSGTIPGRPGAGNIHLSLAAYSLREDLTAGKIDLFDFVRWCARLGLAGAELTSYYFPDNFDRDYLLRLRNFAFHHGVTVSGTAVGNNFCLPPGPQRKEQVDHVARWIDHAADLFAPHIRVFAGNPPAGTDAATAVSWVADCLRELLPRAAQRGVVLGLENHGGITARARDHLAICSAVGENPWFGINLDTGNYRIQPYDELALAAPRAVNVQVKVEVHGSDGEQVPTDFGRVRNILADAAYQGWLVLEYEAEADPWEAIPKHLEELRRLFG